LFLIEKINNYDHTFFTSALSWKLSLASEKISFPFLQGKNFLGWGGSENMVHRKKYGKMLISQILFIFEEIFIQGLLANEI